MSERPSGPRWMLAIPVLLALAALATTINSGLDGIAAGYLIVLIVSVLFVGYSEELLTRGLLIVGFRGGGLREVHVWLFSSLVFAALHGLNLIFGQAFGSTVEQMAFAFLFGSILYVVRRVTGALVICMLLHAFWDFSILLGQSGGAVTTQSASGAVASVLSYLALIGAAVALYKLLEGRGTPSRA